MTRTHLDERFAGVDLDRSVWFPYYLPHWSSRAEAAATWEVRDGELRLTIPPDQPLWCPESHPEPLRVSCVQTGSRTGQQPFADGLVVREEHPEFRGYTPCYGAFEVRMRATVSPRSMVAFWMSGFEDEPEHSGEICVAEVFGDTVSDGPGGPSAAVGIGVHRFRDPALQEEFSAERLDLDIAQFHRYGVDWRPDGLTFTIDGTVVRRSRQSPRYPVQLMIGVFDFPAKATGADEPVPELVVSHVTGRP